MDNKRVMLANAECLQHLKTLPTDSIDALVTDPPAGIGFMGKGWDSSRGGRDAWINWLAEIMQECLRVLKPGGHGLVWSLPRTSHWTAFACDKAGFEIRDCITHVFGSGFPKASALNRAKSGEFCQCDASKHNSGCKIPSPCEAVHSDKDLLSAGDALQPSDVLHSKNIPSDSQADYPVYCDSSDAPARPYLDGARASSQQQECAPAHSRCGELVGDLGSEPLHNPCQALYSGRLSSQDLPYQDSLLPHKDENRKASCGALSQIDSGQNPLGRSDTLQSQSAFPPPCAMCGKPDPKGWYNGGLKPASEHWWLLRKPLSEKTVARNVLKHGTGGINIDGCRVGTDIIKSPQKITDNNMHHGYTASAKSKPETKVYEGRFPANLVLSHHPECVEECHDDCPVKQLDGQSGGGSRFFYVAKASKRDKGADNSHPTVKNTKLMEYLITLITPPNGIVLDPFMGSGSTGVAALRLGYRFYGIEKDKSYYETAADRMTNL